MIMWLFYHLFSPFFRRIFSKVMVEKIYQSATQKPDDQSALIETKKCRSQEVECRHVKIGEF